MFKSVSAFSTGCLNGHWSYLPKWLENWHDLAIWQQNRGKKTHVGVGCLPNYGY